MSSVGPDFDYNRLNQLLWRYRPWIDRFEFLLEMQLMVSGSGRQDWLHHLADLLDDVSRAIGGLDLERDILLGAGLTLSDLATTAPDPWPEILTEQQAHLAAATSRVHRLRVRNQQALETGAEGISRLLGSIAEATGQLSKAGGDSYDDTGRVHQEGGSALLFDGRV